MKIAVNALPLLKVNTGIGQYTKNLIENLGKIDKKNQYVLIVPKKVKDTIKLPKNFKYKIIPEKKYKSPGMRKTWWEQISLPEFIVKEKFDVAFFPYPSNPWTSDFYKRNIKVILTVHDCIPWKNKAYRKGILSKMYHIQSKRAVKKADKIVTVSKSSKEDISKICNIEEKEIKVIYNDVSKTYKRKVSDVFSRKILKKYKLEKENYLVYVGGYDERKNVKLLIDEYLKLDSKMKLVLVGEKLFKNKLYDSLDYSNNKNIINTGFLKEGEISALYKNSFSFVHLSKEEGFNIPVLEAANQEAILILSNIKVHKEVAAKSAIYFDSSLKNSLNKIKIKKVRDMYKKRSKRMAEKYSWEKSAKKFKNMLSLSK